MTPPRSTSKGDFSSEEDSIEIQVTPMVPAPRKPRATNPEIDNVIQAGEIVEPRSLIIRANRSIPTVEIRDEPTAPIQVVVIPGAPTPRRQRFLWLVAAFAPALAAGALTFAEPAPAQRSPSLDPAAEMLGTAFDGEARGALVRAEAIASSSMLRAGIETDPQTLADMSRDKDLTFPVDRNEALEVIQIRDGVRTPMLRIPADTPALAAPPIGKMWLDIHGTDLVVVATAGVATQASGVRGEVVISVPIDLTAIKLRIAERASQGSLMGLRSPVVLVADPARKAGTTVTVPIATKLVNVGGLSLAAVIAPVTSAGNPTIRIARLACLALAGLLLLVFLTSLLFRRDPAIS